MRDAAIDTYRSPARGAGRSRSSGAPPLDDMVGEGPVSRGAPRRGAPTSAAVAAQRLGGGRSSGPSAAAARGRPAPGLVSRLRGRLPRFKPVKALMIGTFGVALVGIVANAMVFQRGHHPAPLFGLGRSVDGASDAAERTAASVPPPPAAVEKTGTIPQAPAAPADPAPPVAVAAAKPAPVHHAAAKAHREEVAIPATPSKSPAADATAPSSHPRPGRAAVARAKPEAHGEAKGEAKPDALAKLLAGPARPAKPETKAAPAAKPETKAAPAAKPETKATPAAKAAAVPPSHPRHRLAAAPADGAAKAPQPE